MRRRLSSGALPTNAIQISDKESLESDEKRHGRWRMITLLRNPGIAWNGRGPECWSSRQHGDSDTLLNTRSRVGWARFTTRGTSAGRSTATTVIMLGAAVAATRRLVVDFVVRAGPFYIRVMVTSRARLDRAEPERSYK